MEQTVVDYRVDDGVATVTLNRPDQLNAMTDGLMSGIRSAVKQIEEDSSVRVLVLTGHGRGFCAGADLVGVAGSSADKNASTESATDPDPGDTFNTATEISDELPGAYYRQSQWRCSGRWIRARDGV